MLVLGSIALDTIETERGTATDCLGGSASHAALAASYFTVPRLVGVVGDDFPPEHHRFLAERVDVGELDVLPGRTFRWHGFHSIETGETVSKLTELNTYERFKPDLSERTRASTHVFLGNIDPELQTHVLRQLIGPRIVACDTMSLWIRTARDKVIDVMRRVDLFLINEEESFELTGADNALEAGRAMQRLGARRVIIKRGSRPSQLFAGDGYAEVPTVPDVDVMDPTGAGDNFAGAMLGFMHSRSAGPDDTGALIEGMHVGSATASFAIEAMGALAHRHLTRDRIEQRIRALAPAR